MDLEIRRSTRADFPAIAELDGASFGFHYSAEDLEDAALDVDPESFLIATDSGRVVAVSGELALRMTLPGGDVAAMGITWVSVELTHRRRGVLTALVEHQLRAHAGEGYAATILAASEGGIYGRYGFGVTSQVRALSLDRRRARIAAPVDTGQVRRVSTDEARTLLPALHERWRAGVPGAVTRSEPRWELGFRDREHRRGGMSGLFHLVHPDGYLSYRIKQDWNDGDPRHLCRIVDYAPITAEAHAALWQVLLSMDLVGPIESHVAPPDDPLPLLLADPRQVRTTHLGDELWLRPLDVPALLGTRRYAVSVDTVLEVRDALLGDARYLLRGGPDGATCARTDREPDVALGVAALGAVCLGGTRLSWLARGGLVGGTPAAVTRLDRALLADRAPQVGSHL